jgi:DNA-binding SARP family transcriptional activator
MQNRESNGKRDRRAWISEALNFRVGDHACSFYQDDCQQWSVALPLLRSNLDNGAKGLVIAESASVPRVDKLFKQYGIRREQCTLTTPEHALSHGAFEVEKLLEQWELLVDGALSEGYKSLCAITDMSWVLRDSAALSHLPEYEARLNEHFARLPLNSLCQYNRHRFSEDLLLDLLRTHPIVFVGSEPHENPYYLPRDVFLSRNHRDEFCWYLSKLGQSPFSQNDAQAFLRLNPDGWQIYCLGELRVLRAGVAVVWDTAHGATRRVKALFAYLLEQGKNGAPKEKLADLLWPAESDLERSLSRLYHTIHALRMALEPDLASADASRYVLSEEDRYVLTLPGETFRDAEAFENLCRLGERAFKAGLDQQALDYYLPAENLYAGDLFSDIPGSCAERLDDDWCWSRRYWLRDMYLKLMLHLAEIYLRTSAISDSLHYWQRALKLDPCCEEAHRGMMRAFHRAGRPDALARQYRICESQLRRQENRPPDAQTLDLWRTLIGRRKS